MKKGFKYSALLGLTLLIALFLNVEAFAADNTSTTEAGIPTCKDGKCAEGSTATGGAIDPAKNPKAGANIVCGRDIPALNDEQNLEIYNKHCQGAIRAKGGKAAPAGTDDTK